MNGLFGRELISPILAGSSPLSMDARSMEELYRQGAGAVVTKNICLPARANPYHYMRVCSGDTLINCERYLDYPGARWLEKEIPKAAAAGVPVIVNVGTNREMCRGVGERLGDSGAFAVECVSYNADWLVEAVDEIRRHCSLPILAKLSPNYPDIVAVARRCVEAGADGFTVGDSKGPILRIDLKTGYPLSGGAGGVGWMSGAGLLPFALRNVMEVRRAFPQLPIIGMGGVTTGEDAVEMVMAGADLVGVCSALVTHGAEVLGQMHREVMAFLENRGVAELKQLRGVVLHSLSEQDSQRDLDLVIDAALCERCGRCSTVCVYDALEPDEGGVPQFYKERCSKCGMCLGYCSALREKEGQ